jgi:BASS family bile acid:Na+ symporter
MNLAELIILAVRVSIFLTVCAFALKASPQDAVYLFRKPGQLARSLLSMNVVMPVFAAVLIAAFDLHPAVKIAMGALSVSPLPPVLPKKGLRSGGKESYTIGLLAAAALLAIVFVPLAVNLLGRIFSIPLALSPGAVARVVLVTVLAPLAAGIAVHSVAPAFADRIAGPVSLVATIMLVAAIVPVLFTQFPAIGSLIGNGTIVGLAVFVVGGLAVGHLLGGPDPEDRTVLALSTASRHPGVAVAIAQANFPEQKLALAAVLLYMLVSGVVLIPYMIWTRRRRAAAARAV